MEDRIEDIVVDGVTGLITPEKNPKALAEAILKLAQNPNLRKKMGEAAREKYALQFDPKRNAEKMLGIYKEVLASKQGDGLGVLT